MSDPYGEAVVTSELARLANALEIVDRWAELNHRYRKLIHDSRALLAQQQVRLTQARGIAKKLMVLVRAAGSDFRELLDEQQARVLDDGLAQANELVYETGPAHGS